MLHHALMRVLEGGEGWRRGENYWRWRAVEMQRRRGGRWRKGNALTHGTGQSVKERREGGEAGHRGVWAKRRDGPAGLSWAAGKTWADGRGKEGGSWVAGLKGKGKGFVFYFQNHFFSFKTLKHFSNFKLLQNFSRLNSFPKFSNKLKTFKTLHHHI
jgi:hypothetical protein